MASFRETREMLCLSHAMGFITDAEFLLLYEESKSDNLDFPYQEYPTFSLPDKNRAECTANLRVEKHHITRLEDALQIPAVFKCDQGTVCDGTEGLCILLKRFAYPCRYSDMIPIFGRPVPEICMINNTVMDWVYENHRHRIMDWNPTVLSAIQLESYADVISNKGAPLTNCFGFVDGTVRPISRPGENQRLVYNGHKRVHGLKYQSVVVPNGLIAHLYGPVEGKMHDAAMLAESHLYDSLQTHAFSTTGQAMCIYGDPAYPLRVHLQAPYRHRVLTPQMQAYNHSMSAVRSSVEWLFGEIVNYFKFLDFKKNLKIGLSQVGKMYIVCGILHNALTCLYGNTTSQFFDLDPPSLEDYFA